MSDEGATSPSLGGYTPSSDQRNSQQIPPPDTRPSESRQLPVIVLRGEYDFQSMPALRAQVEAAATAHGGVILEASGVTFADSMTLSLILATHQRTALRIVAPSERLSRLFSIRGVDAILNIYASVEAANGYR
ncbi:STAS domain-containing protein [Streptomyces microflavus]|uniref:STAS domain-containing protein n=1 Tax=Streptomyces microflavus TaxID=1919 RepID=UPI003673C9ED